MYLDKNITCYSTFSVCDASREERSWKMSPIVTWVCGKLKYLTKYVSRNHFINRFEVKNYKFNFYMKLFLFFWNEEIAFMGRISPSFLVPKQINFCKNIFRWFLWPLNLTKLDQNMAHDNDNIGTFANLTNWLVKPSCIFSS